MPAAVELCGAGLHASDDRRPEHRGLLELIDLSPRQSWLAPVGKTAERY
jgi:hypothetical protein